MYYANRVQHYNRYVCTVQIACRHDACKNNGCKLQSSHASSCKFCKGHVLGMVSFVRELHSVW